jgi:acetyl esterase/lipase
LAASTAVAQTAPAPTPPAPRVQIEPPTSEMLANVEITRDVIYGHKSGMALTYDVFKPTNANGTAVINMISGAWYSTWAPAEARVRGYQALLEKGITVVAMHHGSAPQFKVPEAAADIQRGVRHFKLHAAEYGVDPKRIGAWGASAGGHLSLVAGLQSDDGNPNATDPVLKGDNRIKAVVAYFPPTDMRLFIPYKATAAALDYDDALAESISPALNADMTDPPTLLITGDADRTVPIVNSRIMKEALDKANVKNQLVVYPGADHGWRHADAKKQAEYGADARKRMVAWFVKYL